MSFNKFFKGSVVSSFNVVRKEAGRHLPHAPVVADTFTADSLSAAGLVAAVTF